MGKRHRSDSSSSSDYDSDDRRRKSRSSRSKGKERSRDDRPSSSSSARYKPSRSEQISVDDDFYLKNKEFRHWLSHLDRPKDFAKMESSDQRRYFKKFVKRWNKGKVDRSYYDGSIVGESSRRPERSESPAYDAAGPSVMLGPARPSSSHLALQRDDELDQKAAQRDADRASYKRNTKEARREERENRATGRDRIMEKRQEKREGARAMASAREQGDMEFDEGFLLGSTNSSFQEAIRRRDSSKGAQKKMRRDNEKRAVIDEKRGEHQKKEDQTMAMFKAMAAARYGNGAAS